MPCSKYNECDGFENQKEDEQVGYEDNKPMQWTFANACSWSVMKMLGLHLTMHASLEKKNVVLTKCKFNTRQTSYANKSKRKEGEERRNTEAVRMRKLRVLLMS